MTRLNFRFIPRDPGDFDVCTGPTRPVRVPPATPEAEPLAAPVAAQPAPPEPAQPAKG